MKYPLQMDQEFKRLIELVFKNYLVYAFINGRAALYLIGKDMDIDICVVLDDKIIKKQEEFRKMWKKFVIGYRDIHIKYGFKSDNSFPGDFLTVSQTYDVVSGRGFTAKNEQIYVQPMGNITDEGDENDYRIFRSMFIIGRVITGNKSFFEEIKILCLASLIKYFFVINNTLSIEGVINEFLSGKEKEKYGFDQRYEPEFSRYMKPLIRDVIFQLNKYGFIQKKESNNYEKTQNLDRWGKSILKRQWSSFHLMKFQAPFYIKERKLIFSGVKAGSHWDKLEKN